MGMFYIMIGITYINAGLIALLKHKLSAIKDVLIGLAYIFAGLVMLKKGH